MSAFDLSDDYERELVRVVERIRTMPLTRLAACSDDVFGLCGSLADLARESGSALPGAQGLPRLGDHALPDQLQVLGMEIAAIGDPSTITRAHSMLAEVRKALP